MKIEAELCPLHCRCQEAAALIADLVAALEALTNGARHNGYLWYVNKELLDKARAVIERAKQGTDGSST